MSAERSRLVVAISDLTHDSEALVQDAAMIARHTNARLRVVHPLGVIGESLRRALFGAPTLQQRIEAAAHRLAAQIGRISGGSDIPHEAVLDHHHVTEVLTGQAASGVADIVLAGSTTAGLLSVEALSRLRTPCLFLPRRLERTSRCVIQALSQSISPDSFLRAQRWTRILQALPAPASAPTDPELVILLCPDAAEDAEATARHSAGMLLDNLDAAGPAIAVALLPPPSTGPGPDFPARIYAALTEQADCPVLITPALPALRAVPTVMPFMRLA